jgi:hypothetical protein
VTSGPTRQVLPPSLFEHDGHPIDKNNHRYGAPLHAKWLADLAAHEAEQDRKEEDDAIAAIVLDAVAKLLNMPVPAAVEVLGTPHGISRIVQRRLLARLGFPEQIFEQARRVQGEAPVQHSSNGDPWQGDPMYHPDVVAEELACRGLPDQEAIFRINQVMTRVVAEQEQKKRDQVAARRCSGMTRGPVSPCSRTPTTTRTARSGRWSTAVADLAIVPSPPDEYVELAKTPTGKVYKKHILTVGKTFVHPRTGKPLTVDEAWYARMRRNFDEGLSIVQVPVVGADNAHTEDPLRNAGECIGLERDGDKVLAILDIRDPAVAEKIDNKTLLGASAMLNLNYLDSSSGERRGETLLHCAITNRPHLVDLDPYESVVAASVAESWPFGVHSGDTLMLCEPSPESLVILASPPEIPDNPPPEVRQPAMTYQDEIFRLGQKTAGISASNGGGSVTHGAARLNTAYVNPGRGTRPDYDHEMIAYEHEMRQAEAASAAMSQEVTGDDVRSYLVALSASSGQPFGLLSDAVDELAFSRDESVARTPAARAAAAVDIARRLGSYDASEEGALLGLAAEAESDRILGLARSDREPAEVGDIVSRNPDLFTRPEPRRPLRRLKSYLYADEDPEDETDLHEGAEHPTGKVITTRTRAHSRQTTYNSEVDRLMSEHGYGRSGTVGNPNRSYPAKSQAARQAEAVSARAGGRSQGRITR